MNTFAEFLADIENRKYYLSVEIATALVGRHKDYGGFVELWAGWTIKPESTQEPTKQLDNAIADIASAGPPGSKARIYAMARLYAPIVEQMADDMQTNMVDNTTADIDCSMSAFDLTTEILADKLATLLHNEHNRELTTPRPRPSKKRLSK